MELSVINPGTKKSIKSVEVSDDLYGVEYNEDLAHQAVVAWFAGKRQGSKAQKTRSEVSGGGAKPWRQKGTGRARAGTIRSPLWRTGGVTFAAKPRDYKKKINKKMYRAAIRSIVSELIRQERLTVIDKLEVKAPKTKEFKAVMNDLGVEKGLFVANEANGDVFLASRNLPGVAVATTLDLNPVALIQFDHIVITEQSLSALSEVLA